MPERTARLDWAQVAADDPAAIVGAIAVDAPGTARSVLGRIRKKAEALVTAPESGRVVPELAHFGIRTFRQVVVRPWRLVYRIDGDRILVLAVIDGRRDLEEVLLERLIRPA